MPSSYLQPHYSTHKDRSTPTMKLSITSEAFAKLGSDIATRSTGNIDERTFVAFCGTTPLIISEIWDLVEMKLPKARLPKHVLWACMFMKLHLPEDVLIVLLGTTKPTLRKWAWKVIECIALLSPQVILWEKRKRNLPGDALCSMSVDGTDFKVQEPFPFNRKWMSHKCKGAGLRCEVAISVFSGDIVWIFGPHRGAKHDITIFREKLLHMLEEGEMVEGDKGYIGESDYIRARDDYSTVRERREKNRLRARHETCNGRFKCWGILKQECRHDIKKHEWAVRSVVVMTQLAINNGDCLFGCEPETRTKDCSCRIDDVDLDA